MEVNKRIEKYFKSKRLNSSTLKKVWEEPQWVEWKQNNPEAEDENTSALRIGSALDTALTDSDNFVNLYHVSNDKRPWGLMGKFIDNLPLEINEDSDLALYEQAYKIAGYKISLERAVKKLWSNDKYLQFFLARKAALGKHVLSSDEYNIVLTAKDAIVRSPYALPYFISNDPFRQLYLQVPIYFEYKGVECKALLDGLVIDLKENTAHLYDLKSTVRKAGDFEWPYINYSYYLQVAFYNIALHMLKEGKATTDADIDLDILKECTITEPKFIVVTKSEIKSSVRIYEVSKNGLEKSVIGGITRNTGRPLPGVDELVDAYKWHKERGYWELPRRFVENDGVCMLNVFDT